MQMLFQSGFAGDPPGWRWDYFRRLEQSATVEVFPVVAETLAASVIAPSEATLRAFFDQYKNDLPAARSAEPGFREPHRAKYEYLVAKREAFEAAAAKEITDAQITDYYEKNKTSLFRAQPAAKPAADAGKGPAAEKPEAKTETTAPDAAKPAAAETQPPESKPAAPESPATEPKPATPEPPAPESKPAPDKGSDARRPRFVPVAFRQPDTAAEKPAAGEQKEPAPPAAPAAEQNGKPQPPATEQKTESTPAAPADDAANFEPLEKVKDDIRQRLARQEADKRIDAIFSAIATDMSRYAEDFALWQAGGKAAGAAAPAPPNFEKIAATQGLEAGRSEKLVTADEAVAAGPIGGSFELVPDASSRFGIRQQRWIDMIFGQGAPTLRPVTSRDVEGNRSISWKTEDQPEFTPTFQAARADVERAWRIVEARSVARKKAEEIARKVDAGETLAAAAGTAEPKVEKVGPFTWLTQGTVPMGTPPSLSQPEGIAMPGEEFMQAVFGLEPGKTAVAFNEPRTVCYVIRLETLEPPLEKLRENFMAARDDQRRLAMVAQRETSRATAAWVEALENRHALTWRREPR
jgi:hypothetical protein